MGARSVEREPSVDFITAAKTDQIEVMSAISARGIGLLSRHAERASGDRMDLVIERLGM